MTLLTNKEFNDSEFYIAICGIYLGNSAVHVGIALKDEGLTKVIHFLDGNNIPYVNIFDIKDSEQYYFNPIKDFNNDLLPSMSALCSIISEEPSLNNFNFHRTPIVYNGGKFDIHGFFSNNKKVETLINCAIFSLSILYSYDYLILDWESWPISENSKNYLDDWFKHFKITDKEEQDYFYNTAKDIRGKHLIACPFTVSKPSVYIETEHISNELISSLMK